MKGNNSNGFSNDEAQNIFSMTGKIGASGNIMSLLYGDDFEGELTISGYRFCFRNMFNGCTSLTTAPELPATTLAGGCYAFMFGGCPELNYIKMLATDVSTTNCLLNWVDGVASTGTFIKHPNMTSLPTGSSGIPEGWTVQDAA